MSTNTADKDRSGVAMFTPVQVGISALFGSLLAGFMCIALNYQALGEHKKVLLTTVISIVVVPVFLVLFIFLKDQAYIRLLPIISAVLIGILAQVLQGQSVQNNNRGGGRTHSVWRLVSVVIVSLLLLLFLFTITVLIFQIDIVK